MSSKKSLEGNDCASRCFIYFTVFIIFHFFPYAGQKAFLSLFFSALYAFFSSHPFFLSLSLFFLKRSTFISRCAHTQKLIGVLRLESRSQSNFRWRLIFVCAREYCKTRGGTRLSFFKTFSHFFF